MATDIFDPTVPKSEREHVGDIVDLCLPDGRLNPAAVSWSRTPHINANLRGWGRRKRFEYWAIATEDLVFAFSFSHADYRGGLAVYVLDLHTLREVNDGEARWFPGRVDLPPTSGRESMRRVGARSSVAIIPGPGGTVLNVATPRISARLTVTEPPGHESMGVVVPWNARTFQYTRKDAGLHASGWVEVDGERRPVREGWATLDHGRGRWPFQVTWNWGAGYGVTDGHEIGIQLGAKWTDGTPSTENAIRIDGRIEKLSHDVEWTYDTTNFLAPWRFTSPQVDLTFTPVHNRHGETKKFFFSSREDQAFGHYAGTITTADGVTYAVRDVFGWAEEVQRRW